MKHSDVVVVGAGISGLLTALALSKEGKNVLVLEESSEVGGVCRSYMVDGYQVDTGPHIITRLEGGPLKELMQKYFDVVPNFVPHGRYYIKLNNRIRAFPWNLQGWFEFDLIPQMDRLNLMKTLFSVSYLYNAGEDFSRKSLGELAGGGLSESTLRFLNCMSIFMTGAPMNETPVARFLDSERYKSRSSNVLEKLHNILMKEGAQDQFYPKGGLQSLITAVQSSMPEGRVEIRTCEKVVKIDAGNKKVETTEDEYGYDTLIYSGFASDLPALTGDLSDDYRQMLGKLPKSNILTIWLGLKEQVFKRQGSEIWVDADPYTWVVPVSNYDPSLAPKDRQLVGCAFRLGSDANLEKEKKRSLEAIYRIMPDLEKKVDMTHYQMLIPEKAMWTIATQFAGVKTPLEGVYLVGTDTEKRSMGVTRASYSVLKLLGTLKQDRIL